LQGARVALAIASLLVACGLGASADEPTQLEKPGDAARAAGDTVAGLAAAPLSAAKGTAARRPASFFPKLGVMPLEPPLTVNGGFGEYRPGHFHAGVDLGTGERVGKRVRAPLAGSIVRVRTSGVGYGRSLYLEAADGRLLQFGHLDAFMEPLAAYVAAAQESSGQYEQDLWLEKGRFAVRAGDSIAWSGESGVGPPHLHFEVRVGDMAYNPFRSGLEVRDVTPPTLTTLTLEPLDDTSFVARCAAPLTVRLGARRETLLVEGRVRAEVDGFDGAGGGARRIEPWSISAEFAGRTVECRFDSLSWATDMAESDYLFDAGRIVGDRGVVLWAPAGFRPRALLSDVPRSEECGTITVRPGDPPRPLRIVARDVAGLSTTRTVLLRAPRARERGRDTTRAGGAATPVAEAERFEFGSLPGGFWRVTYRGAPPGSMGVTIDLGPGGPASFAASTRGVEWTAVIPRDAWQAPWSVRGRDAAGAAWSVEGPPLVFGDGSTPGALAAYGENMMTGLRWQLPSDARFEPGAVAKLLKPVEEQAPLELAAVAMVGRIEPAGLALRKPVHLSRGFQNLQDTTGRVGLYRHDPDGWSWLAGLAPGATSIQADSRRLGTFELFADTLAPRLSAFTPARKPAPGPYNRWALEARVSEDGSGLDPRASYFEVDGVRVPSEWDAENRTLRWRPRVPPAVGTHRFTVTATDRAGNVGRSTGSFVID
jgi:hypothetical protein